MTALGLVENGCAVERGGARPGDKIIVSGQPGRASRALADLQAGRSPDEDHLQALHFPQPRLQLGRFIQGIATACIDISDGLLADLGHILEASGTGARLDTACLPLQTRDMLEHQLSGGDDYELCFTLPASRLDELPRIIEACGLELSVIGEITSGSSLVIIGADGKEIYPESSGFEHFQSAGGANG